MALTALIRGGMARRRVAKELSGKAWFGEAKRGIATEKLCVELQRQSKAEFTNSAFFLFTSFIFNL